MTPGIVTHGKGVDAPLKFPIESNGWFGVSIFPLSLQHVAYRCTLQSSHACVHPCPCIMRWSLLYWMLRNSPKLGPHHLRMNPHAHRFPSNHHHNSLARSFPLLFLLLLPSTWMARREARCDVHLILHLVSIEVGVPVHVLTTWFFCRGRCTEVLDRSEVRSQVDHPLARFIWRPP